MFKKKNPQEKAAEEPKTIAHQLSSNLEEEKNSIDDN
jgi:hypothetical protein